MNTEKSQFQEAKSWLEYEQCFSDEANGVRNFMAYRNLANSDRRFWNEEIYKKLKQNLGGDDWLKHSGVTLFDQHQRAQPRPRAASDEALPERIQAKIKSLQIELEAWKRSQCRIPPRTSQLINTILEGKSPAEPQLQETLQASSSHFTGVWLAYQIAKAKSNLTK